MGQCGTFEAELAFEFCVCSVSAAALACAPGREAAESACARSCVRVFVLVFITDIADKLSGCDWALSAQEAANEDGGWLVYFPGSCL